MAVAVRSSASVVATASQTTLVVPVPAGTANDDILIMAVFNTATTGVITSPAGWNVLSANDVPASSTSSHASLFWRKAASEPASYTVTMTSGRGSALMLCLTGADTTAPIDVSGVAVDTTADLSLIAPSVTATVASMLITIAGGRTLPNGSSVSFSLAGQTEQVDVASVVAATSNSGCYAGTEALGATGATGTRTVTATVATTVNWIAYNLVVKAAAGGGGGSVPTGPNYPGTTATLSNAGTSESAEAWVSPGNIVSDNATEASITAATYDSPDISQLLVASNFGFAIPAGATIDGIIVEIDRRSIIASSGVDNRVQLSTSTAFAGLVGTNKATATVWPSTTAVATYGGATDTWSAGLTAAQVNAAGFAVMLSAKANIANADIGVDYIRVTVYYTEVAATPVTGTADSTFGWSDTAAATEDIPGTAASTFGWSTSATASEGFSGVASATFGWSTSASASEDIPGAAASTFGWSDTASGISAAPVTGTGASTFGWSDSATGNHVENATGTAASTFGFSTAGTGAEDIAGSSASSFGWSTTAAASEGFSGAASASFGWSTSASASEDIPGVAGSTFGWSDTAAATVLNPVTGTSASSFGFSTTAAATENIPGVAASTFGWSDSATGSSITGVGGNAASTFGWSTAGSGTQTIPAVTGTGASTFAGGIAGSGTLTAPAITGIADSTFGWSTSGTGTNDAPYFATPPDWNTITYQTERSEKVAKF